MPRRGASRRTLSRARNVSEAARRREERVLERENRRKLDLLIGLGVLEKTTEDDACYTGYVSEEFQVDVRKVVEAAVSGEEFLSVDMELARERINRELRRRCRDGSTVEAVKIYVFQAIAVVLRGRHGLDPADVPKLAAVVWEWYRQNQRVLDPLRDYLRHLEYDVNPFSSELSMGTGR